MGQSAKSFQGNYLSTFPDACQYLRALCRLRIPRFASSGSGVSEEARPLPRTIQSEQQRAEAEEQLCGFLPPGLAEPPGVRPHTVRPSAAARAGAAAANLGCENCLGRAKKKCFSVHSLAQSTAGHQRRRGRQPRQRQQLRRTGKGCWGCAGVTPRAAAERGGGAATVVARAGPCSHHLGDAEGTGDSSRSADRRAPPRCPQPRAALTIAPGPSLAGARAQGTPDSPRPGRWSPNFLRIAARSPGSR